MRVYSDYIRVLDKGDTEGLFGEWSMLLKYFENYYKNEYENWCNFYIQLQTECELVVIFNKKLINPFYIIIEIMAYLVKFVNTF